MPLPPSSDPYAGYPFRWRWDGRLVAGFRKVSLPDSEQTTFAAIPCEDGLSCDTAFAQWANGNQDGNDRDFRKDLVLEVFDAAGKSVGVYAVFHAWSSRFVAVPDLDRPGFLIETLVLQNEGWSPQLG